MMRGGRAQDEEKSRSSLAEELGMSLQKEAYLESQE